MRIFRANDEQGQPISVGGQAVLEGVMMRAPAAYSVAVRLPSGQVATKEKPWRSITGRLGFLKWPFVRGGLVIVESLVNGLDALTFSASQALEEEEGEEMGPLAMALTIGAAFGLAMLLFVVLPHYLSLLAGRLSPWSFGVESMAFHAIDGALKVAFFLAYIWIISRFKEIARVFEYHGAEHKSIYAFEAGEELTVENARKHTTLHPRCGTAFILVVLLLSIFLFTAVFPFLVGASGSRGFGLNLLYILIKILLMFPVAGVAYEINRWASRHMDRPLVRVLVWPGLLMQRLTTREPSDDQIEIALIALKNALKIEAASEAA